MNRQKPFLNVRPSEWLNGCVCVNRTARVMRSAGRTLVLMKAAVWMHSRIGSGKIHSVTHPGRWSYRGRSGCAVHAF